MDREARLQSILDQSSKATFKLEPEIRAQVANPGNASPVVAAASVEVGAASMPVRAAAAMPVTAAAMVPPSVPTSPVPAAAVVAVAAAVVAVAAAIKSGSDDDPPAAHAVGHARAKGITKVSGPASPCGQRYR